MQLEQCERSGFRSSLSTALPAQFATEMQDVQLARVHTEDKKYGDLTFGYAIYQQTQHRVLASSERPLQAGQSAVWRREGKPL